MKSSKLLTTILLLALIDVSGCAGIQVGGNVQAGRRALQAGRPTDAVAHLTRAVDTDPAYKLPYRVPASALSYLGRAYYEIGKDNEARSALEKAVRLDKDDALAHLYLGLVLMRAGDRNRGRKEVEAGLKGIYETLEYIASDITTGFFWDPARAIRSEIDQTLARERDDSQLALAAVRIGADFDEEIDKARRDESRRRRGGGNGSGN